MENKPLPEKWVTHVATIQNRPEVNGCNLKPGAEKLNGVRGRFQVGWYVDEDDGPRYQGEAAMIPDRDDEALMGALEEVGISWIASGDLVFEGPPLSIG